MAEERAREGDVTQSGCARSGHSGKKGGRGKLIGKKKKKKKEKRADHFGAAIGGTTTTTTTTRSTLPR